MNCQKIKKLLNPYIDQALDADMTKQVDGHLKSCPACREEHLKLKKIVSALNSISPQPVPADFTQSIMIKISQKEIQIQSSWMNQLKKRISIPSLSFPRKWESISSFRLVGAAAVATLIVFFAFTFVFNTPDTSPICSAEVQFSLKINDSKAHTVAIAGDFNGWNPQANILEDTEGDGIWIGTLKLGPGRYEYMFVLDGEKWFPDPNALRYVKDGFGNKNAILEINNCNST
ncbi:MAG: zf-HC2 domain-containing protein [Atribacterota bacterium]